jgi:hypothetical protein
VSPIDQSTLGTLPRRRIYAFSWPTERGEAVPDKEARLPGVQHSRLADVRRFSITMPRGRLRSVTPSGLAVLPERTPAAAAAAATARFMLRSFLFWGWWRVSPATSSALCDKVSPTRQLLQRNELYYSVHLSWARNPTDELSWRSVRRDVLAFGLL